MNVRTIVAALVGGGLAASALTMAGPALAETPSTIAKPVPTTTSSDDLMSQGLESKMRLLAPYESVLRKLPKVGTDHNYRYTTTYMYWSAMAVWSPGTGDADLELYGDKAQTQLLDKSTAGTGQTDFVAVDSNYRALGSYYPKIKTYSGYGDYYAELAEGAQQLTDGTTQVYMASDNVVSVRDTFLFAGTTYTFTLKPGTLNQDGNMFLMGSRSDDPTTWVQSRSDAVAWSAKPGGGVTETFQYTPTVTDWYGLVLTNELIGGSYDLTRTAS